VELLLLTIEQYRSASIPIREGGYDAGHGVRCQSTRKHAANDFDGQTPAHDSRDVAGEKNALKAKPEFAGRAALTQLIRGRQDEHFLQVAIEAAVDASSGAAA
jgi:hypothetical protein